MEDNVVELNIHQRIHAIMKDVSYVQKGNKKVNNHYKFVSHDAVTSKVRPALLKHGVLAVPSYFDISVHGNRTNCSMSMKFVNIDKPEDYIDIPCAGFGQGIDPQDKGAGKAMSYAYKYALLKIFALETGDDPEKDNINHKPEPKPPTPAQEARKSADEIIKEYKACKDLDSLSDVQKKRHKHLAALSKGYESLFTEINAIGLLMIESFDND